MALNVEKELAELRRMTPRELRQKYRDVFSEVSRSGHKQWLVKRIIWRLQANAEGGLSERARQRALELANDADLRLKAPATPRVPPEPSRRPLTYKGHLGNDRRLPMPGAVITRDYKGQTLHVHVLADGLEFEGTRYGTLSAVAKAITGTHTNGYLFFRLGKYGGGA